MRYMPLWSKHNRQQRLPARWPMYRFDRSRGAALFLCLKLVNAPSGQWYDPVIYRYDRRRTILVQAASTDEDAFSALLDIKKTLQDLTLPPGYSIELAGEFQNTVETQLSLLKGMPVAVVAMILSVMALFNAFRTTLVVFAVVPFALIGVLGVHWLSGMPISFISTLGIFSLSGMMIKNAVVLLDEVNHNNTLGMPPYEALITSAQSRLLPVFNASLTTVLGLIPLLWDVFWQSMAVTIMGGLMVGAFFTIVLVPLMYAILYRVKPPGK